MRSNRIELPTYAMRALHSRLVDWLMDEGVEMSVRHAMIGRCEGATFDAFISALLRERLVVTTRTDADTGRLLIGVGIPAHSKVVPLIELADPQTGVSADDVVGMQTLDLDAELVALLGGAAGSDEQ